MLSTRRVQVTSSLWPTGQALGGREAGYHSTHWGKPRPLQENLMSWSKASNAPMTGCQQPDNPPLPYTETGKGNCHQAPSSSPYFWHPSSPGEERGTASRPTSQFFHSCLCPNPMGFQLPWTLPPPSVSQYGEGHHCPYELQPGTPNVVGSKTT